MANFYESANPVVVDDMKRLLEGVSKGNKTATVQFQERLGTVDGAFAFANLSNVSVQEWFGNLPDTWSRYAGKIVVPDFRNVHFVQRTLDFSNFEAEKNGQNRPAGVLPGVAEGETYQNFALNATVLGWGVEKQGGAIGFTWEAIKNDVYGTISDMPRVMAEYAINVYDWKATQALWATLSGDAVSKLQASTFQSTPINAPLTLNAINAAKSQLAVRTAPDGTYINAGSTQYVLNYSPALQGQVDFLQAQQSYRVINTNGSQQQETISQVALGNIDFVSNRYLATAAGSANAWTLSIVPQGTRAPVLVGFLAGEETPEVRVSGLAGYTTSGAQLPYTSGSFNSDVADLRVRTVAGAGATPFGSLMGVWSTGTGQA